MVAFKTVLSTNRIKKIVPQKLKKWWLRSTTGSGSAAGAGCSFSAASRWARISLRVVKVIYRVDCRCAKPWSKMTSFSSAVESLPSINLVNRRIAIAPISYRGWVIEEIVGREILV